MPAATATPTDTLVEQHVLYAKKLVYKRTRHMARHVDVDGMVGAGLEALTRAAQRWEPADGVSFAAYAAHQIVGAVVNQCIKDRPGSWSRAAHTKAALQDAVARLVEDLGRYPTIAEVAHAMGMTISELHDARAQAERCQLDVVPDDALHQIVGGNDPQDVVITRERRRHLWAAINCLPANLRTAVVQLDINERPTEEVALEEGVSPRQMRNRRREGRRLIGLALRWFDEVDEPEIDSDADYAYVQRVCKAA